MKKQEIELFTRKYRRYFSDKDVIDDACPTDAISLKYPYTHERRHALGDNFYRYVEDMRKVYADLEEAGYDAALKAVWLEYRFGMQFTKMSTAPTSNRLNVDLKEFLNRICMVQRSMFFPPKVNLMKVIRWYAEDLYPGFYEILNPITSKLVWPFKTARLCYLLTVADMDEALGLLQVADEKKMTYNEFLDFVANWVACYNEKYGEKYQFITTEYASGVPATVSNLMAGAQKSRAQLLSVVKDE